MAAARAASHELLTFEDGGTAMKLLHIHKKLPPLAQKCQAGHRSLMAIEINSKKPRIIFICLWSSVVTYTHQVHTVMTGGHSVASSQAPLS